MSDKKTALNSWGLPDRKVQKCNFDKSMTVQSHSKGLTVNEIMKRFAVTRTIPDRGIPVQFLDTTLTPNLFDALNLRVSLNKYFMGLDSQKRAFFQNNPLNLVKFVNDPKNTDLGVKMGVLKLNDKGLKAKAQWDADQAKKAEDKRQAFVADVESVIRKATPPTPNPS